MVLRCPDYPLALQWARLECKSYKVPPAISRITGQCAIGRTAVILALSEAALTSSHPKPPFKHCAMVGDYCAGPPKPSIRSDHA